MAFFTQGHYMDHPNVQRSPSGGVSTDLNLTWKKPQKFSFLWHTPEKVFIRRVYFTHCLPLLPSLSLHTGRQNSHDFITEVGGAGVRSWQHVSVREPIRGFTSVAFTHQEDTESQERGEVVFPAGQGDKYLHKKKFWYLKWFVDAYPLIKGPR